MKTREEAQAIFKKFNIQVEETDDAVYKVTNTYNEVCLEELQWLLEESIILASKKLRAEKSPNDGEWISYHNVYYILTDYEDKVLLKKYLKYSRSEHSDTLILSYRQSNPNTVNIDTIYRKDSL